MEQLLAGKGEFTLRKYYKFYVMNVKFEYFSENVEATNLSVVTKNLNYFMLCVETQVCLMCGNLSSLCTQQTTSFLCCHLVL